MPDEKVVVGGREYEVFCQAGEESFLRGAAALLDAEAQTLVDQAGRVPETRMLLMAGLMLADKTAEINERLRTAEARLQEAESEVARLKEAPPPDPERVEVPVIPANVLETLAEFAARSEALAQDVEERGRET